MKTSYLFFFLFFCISLSIPVRLSAQADDSWKVYSDTSLARVDVTIDTARLAWIYANTQSDSEHPASIHFHNAWIDETIDSVGFRLRGNTSRDAQKKSFKISFNSFTKGARFHGVKKLNLNGEHNDPSIIRSKLCFDLYHDIGSNASRAAHAKVYINGAYYGLYVSVEDIDDEFLAKRFANNSGNLWKCLYPADLTYVSNNPADYAALNSGGRPAYELQTNEMANDFTQIARIARILHSTPAGAMADSLDASLDVPAFLKYFAMDVLVGSWDDYRSLMNNYYLYHIPNQNKLTVIPYDYDNTFSVDWSGNNWSTANPYDPPKVVSGARPLSEALLAQNQYKDLFTHFLKVYSTNMFPLARWESRIDRLKDTITAAALEDTYRTRDWGFTADDFNNSYSALSYSNQQVKMGLKQWVNARLASLPAQLTFTNAAPQAYSIALSSQSPAPGDSLRVTAACFGAAGVKSAVVQVTIGQPGVETDYPMTRAAIAGSMKAEEVDRWTATLPPFGPGVRATLRILVTDSLNHTQINPRTSSIAVQTPALASSGLVINELLADNTNVLADPAGEFDDWLELYNPTTEPILLTGLYLTDNPAARMKWRFTSPNQTIGAGEHLLIWCDDQATEAGIHTNFKFSASGEFCAITDTDGVTVIDSVTFGAQKKNISFGRYPDAGPLWGTMTPTPQATNVAPSGNGFLRVPLHVGWNMVSPSMGGVGFPWLRWARGGYAYYGGYFVTDTMRLGGGYWLNCDTAKQMTIAGTVVPAETLALKAKWNLIGGVSVPAPVTNITAITPGLTTGRFFGYTNTYAVVETLLPGHAYWVKSNGEGSIRIAGAGSVLSGTALRVIPDGDMPPPPPGGVVAENQTKPHQFQLGQNYPNPFNPSTHIPYELPDRSHVKITLCNMLGQEVQTVVNAIEDAGWRSVLLDVTGLPSGVYFYRMSATPVLSSDGTFVAARKLVVIK